MEERYIKFDTANLAKSKGLELGINVYRNIQYYNYKGEFKGDSTMEIKHRKEKPNPYANIAAPSQAIMMKWLREIHGIHVTPKIFVNTQLNKVEHATDIFLEKNLFSNNAGRILRTARRDEYEDGIEEGIIKALELL